MKASDLILELQEAIREHGDLEVAVPDAISPAAIADEVTMREFPNGHKWVGSTGPSQRYEIQYLPCIFIDGSRIR